MTHYPYYGLKAEVADKATDEYFDGYFRGLSEAAKKCDEEAGEKNSRLAQKLRHFMVNELLRLDAWKRQGENNGKQRD